MAAISGLVLALAVPAGATVYGLKSKDLYSAYGQYSGHPVHLFSFVEDGTTFRDIGLVTLGPDAIDADGLAASATYGLMAFQLTEVNDAQDIPRDSRLISIDPSTGEAAAVGDWIIGRDIRGAVFDLADDLWALDARNSELLRVDPTTGIVVPGSVVALDLPGALPNISRTFSDLAAGADGSMYMAMLDHQDPLRTTIFSINPATGDLTALHTTDRNQVACGVTFSADGDRDDLFAYEVVGAEDIFCFDRGSGFTPALLWADIIPSFNAGRGDLAAIVPGPATLSVLALGALTVIRRRKR